MNVRQMESVRVINIGLAQTARLKTSKHGSVLNTRTVGVREEKKDCATGSATSELSGSTRTTMDWKAE